VRTKDAKQEAREGSGFSTPARMIKRDRRVNGKSGMGSMR
jgi:hypothetical protein